MIGKPYIAGALLLAVVTIGAACGDDDGDAASPTTVAAEEATTTAADAATTAAAATWPVTVEHTYGTISIPERPQRIVSLNVQWTDVLLAMEVQPVGVPDEPLAGPNGRYPWQSDLGADVTGIPLSDGLPLEQIAALQPDLIVATFVAAEKPDYDNLAAIAPTIGLLRDEQVDRWQDQVDVAGRFLGEPDRAQEVIAAYDQLIADTKSELPGLAGKTFALANYVPSDSIYVVADPDDGATRVFQELGLQIDPAILAAADGVSGRAQLSLEQAGLLGADLLIIFSNDGDPHDLVGYDQLAPVIAGAVAELDFAAVVGLNTPTPLSIPYSLDLIRPALDVIGAAS